MSHDTFVYFAYGSNMLGPRMLLRAPSARRIGLASLPNFSLRWHKVSKDGSGKCDIEAESGSVVYGVLYEIKLADKPGLDLAEGLSTGYREVQLEVHTDRGTQMVTSYQATNIDRYTTPYSWYKTLVLEGARQQQLDPVYIRALEAVPSREDRNSERAADNLKALHAH